MDQPKVEIKIETAELQKRKLFVGTPMYGGAAGGLFTRSIADLSALCTHHKVQLQLHFLFNESLITRARNYIVDEFLRSNSDHLMFIDADIGFDARDVLALVALQTKEEKYDIIGGPYPKKCISWEKIKQAVDKGLADENPGNLEKFVGDYVFNPKDGTQQIPLFVPAEVREVGTGFMCTRRDAFDKFAKAYPHYNYRPDHVRTAFFDGSREIMQYFQAEIDGIDFAAEYRGVIDDLLKNSKKEETLVIDQETLTEKMTNIQKKADQRTKRYLSEDYWFTQRCHDIGLRTWLCPWMKLQHMGTYVFGGSLVDLAQAGAAATADPRLLNKKAS